MVTKVDATHLMVLLAHLEGIVIANGMKLPTKVDRQLSQAVKVLHEEISGEQYYPQLKEEL